MAKKSDGKNRQAEKLKDTTKPSGRWKWIAIGAILVAILAGFVIDFRPMNFVTWIWPAAPVQNQGVHWVGGDGSDTRRGDVVFIHGLDGDAWKTWGDKNAEFYWPGWLAKNAKDFGVWTVQYDAAPSELKGNPMGIGDRATSIIRQLHHKGVGRRPVIFVCHSLGGIIVKRMIVDSGTHPKDAELEFYSNVKGVAFLATPHSGSNAGTFAKLFKVYKHSILVDALKRNDDNLRTLNKAYRSIAPQRGLGTLVLVEKYDIKGLGRIVEEDSADLGLDDATIVPVNENHLSISEPKSGQNDVVIEVSRFIDKYLIQPPERVKTTLKEFVDDYSEAVGAEDFSKLRRKYDGKQFEWTAIVATSIPKKENIPLSTSAYALSDESDPSKRKYSIGAAFERFDSSFKKLKPGAEIVIQGAFSKDTSASLIKLDKCRLIKFNEDDVID